MVRSARPTSSARAAPAATTAAGSSPALGIGEEREHHRNHLVGELDLRVVPGALDHLKVAEAGRECGHDRRTLGLRIGPVRVEAALDDQDTAADVAELGAGVGRGGAAHAL